MINKTVEKILSKKKVIFFFLLFLVILPITCAEILSETSERNCLNNSCVYSISQSKMFHNYNNEWYYFDQFTTLNVVGRDLVYSNPITTSTTATQLNLSIWVTYNGRDMPLNSLTGTQITAFNPKYILSKGRDEYKFNLTFIKPREITRIGFKISSNREFSYNSLLGYSDNIISNNMELSLQDLKDSGYAVILDKVTEIYWIDISRMAGVITLDPVSTFYSSSKDGSLVIEETFNSCINAGGTATTSQMGYMPVTPIVLGWVLFEFNTSVIASDQQIDYANLSLYNGRYDILSCGASNYITYDIGGGTFGTTFNCSDRLTDYNYQLENWTEDVGYKVRDILPQYINRTTSTLFQIEPYWVRYTCGDGSYKYWTVRMSEFSGTTYDPKLTVITSTISTTPKDEKIEKNIYPLLLIFIIVFVMAILPKPKNVI